jgi:hypothetical protein
MFKYISEILSKFTQGQRIMALILLLFSVILISIGPKIAETLTSSDEELVSRVESQTIQILELNNRVTELNTQIISNQRQCTDAIVEREKEIMGEIIALEGRVKRQTNPLGESDNGRGNGSGTPHQRMSMKTIDTVNMEMIVLESTPPPPIQKEKTQPTSLMLDGLSKIKKNLNNSINSKKKN